MDINWGETTTFDFTTHNPNTGNIQNADVLPTCQVFEDSDNVPLLTPVIVQRGALVGDYRVTVIIDAANGFTLNRVYNIVVTATVNAITAKSRIAVFMARARQGVRLKV
jgi:hypothetical protein